MKLVPHHNNIFTFKDGIITIKKPRRKTTSHNFGFSLQPSHRMLFSFRYDVVLEGQCNCDITVDSFTFQPPSFSYTTSFIASPQFKLDICLKSAGEVKITNFKVFNDIHTFTEFDQHLPATIAHKASTPPATPITPAIKATPAKLTEIVTPAKSTEAPTTFDPIQLRRIKPPRHPTVWHLTRIGKNQHKPHLIVYHPEPEMVERLLLYYQILTDFNIHILPMSTQSLQYPCYLKLSGVPPSSLTELKYQIQSHQHRYLLEDFEIVDNFTEISNSLPTFKSNLLTEIASNRPGGGKIGQIYVSNALRRFAHKIKREYGLRDYNSKYQPSIFFGCYNQIDFSKIDAHRGGVVLIWGGTDLNTLESKNSVKDALLKRADIRHIAISSQIAEKLEELGFNRIERVQLRLLDWQLYRTLPLFDTNVRKAVYIYTSLEDERAINIYGAEYYREVIHRMPDIKFLIAYGQYSDQQIVDIYNQSFVGLRLTRFDGSANTVQELGLLGIRCIHNGDLPNSIAWNTVDDICTSIRHEFTRLHMDQRGGCVALEDERQKMLDFLGKANYQWLFWI